tara:strand:- start:222 stop:743 length:522 start_codon:yes stop_codon:yes gene_type:complete
MPFLANTTTGGVVYSSPTWETKILAEQWETDAAGYGPASSQTAATDEGTTYRTITPLNVDIGKYERMLLKYRIHWTQNTTGRAKFKLDTPTITSIHTVATGLEPDGTLISDIDVAADPVLEQNIAGTAGYLEWESIIENAGTAGTINFQFGQYANNAAPVIVLEGSYVEIKKF